MMFAAFLLLEFAALAVAAWVSPARGWRLWVALLVLGWIVGHFNALVEAVAFNVMSLADAAAVAGGFLIVVAILSALAVLVTGKWPGEGAPPVTPCPTPLRLLGVVAGYELLYFGAGMLVFPFVAHFYADKALPSFAFVAGLQVPRALIFVLAAWPWLRTGPRAAPLTLGMVFAVVGAIAPLLPENPFMPADIRFAHGIETASSNFLFGLLVGWLLKPKAA
jgi:hypothetical protein